MDKLGFRSIGYDFAEDTALADYAARVKPDWRPDRPGPLDEVLPKKLSKLYIEKFKQPFSPRHFSVNAFMLANYVPPDEKAREARDDLVEQLYRQFLEFSTLEDGARFVVYKFERRFKTVWVTPPWTSAYASGAALLAMAKWIEAFADTRFRDTAEEVLAGMARLRRRKQQDLWVSFVDKESYLWFEEMPLPVDPQPRILNGHIRALTGLYHYHRVTGSELAGRLLRGGITTVRYNVERYRVPGEINRYGLRTAHKDYGPQRTVTQQRELHAMTGDRYFLDMAELFAADHAAAAVVA